MAIPPNIPAEQRDILYRSFETAEELVAKYRDLIAGIASLKFLAGFCYTVDRHRAENQWIAHLRSPA
jgi:hypothetical protein